MPTNRRVVDRVGDLARVLVQFLVGLNFRPGRDLLLQPFLERLLGCNLPRLLQTVDEALGIVVFRISKVGKVERRVRSRVRGSEVDATLGSRSGNVGCDAECVIGSEVAVSLGIVGEWHLVCGRVSTAL